MSKRMRLAAAFVAVLGSALAVFAPARAQAPGVIIGTLSCSVASGFGFIFGSSRAINCTFAGPGGRYEHYVGNISKFGVERPQLFGMPGQQLGAAQAQLTFDAVEIGAA